jgi:hypothetical protein
MKFGDVFKYNEFDYVYLAGVDEVIYTAKIFELSYTAKFENLTNNTAKNGKTVYRLDQNKIYCYVKLTTEELKNRVAHIGLAESKDDQSFSIDSIGCSLNTRDLIAIKKEILDGPVDINLKDNVRNIEITNDETEEIELAEVNSQKHPLSTEVLQS